MSDGTSPTKAADDDDAKDAVPDGKAANPGLLPKKEMTFSQHLFIWTMVILVGVVFGGVGYDGIRWNRSEDGVDPLEIRRAERIAVTLQDALNPQRHPEAGEIFLEPPTDRQKSPYVRWLRKAQLAFDEGHKPTEEVARQLVKDFLARTASERGGSADGKRTYYDVLVELNAKDRPTEEDLAWFLSRRHAIRAMETRRVALPVVPTAVAEAMAGLGHVLEFGGRSYPQFGRQNGDRVKLDMVTLTAKPFMDQATPDESELQATYDRLSASDRFMDPRRAVVAVAYVDLKGAFEKAKPTAEQIKAHYEANKERYRDESAAKPEEKKADAAKPDAAKPDEKKADEKPAVVYKPLETVRDAIETELWDKAKAELRAVAARTMRVFAERLQDEAFDEQDQAAFVAAATKDGLTVREGVLVDEPASRGQLTVPELGPVKGSDGAARLFIGTSKPGHVTSLLTIDDPTATPLVMRLDGLRPAQLRPLSDPAVRKQVAEHLAGRKAWPKLLAAARELREKAEKAGPGGLRKLFDDPELQKTWAPPPPPEPKDPKAPKPEAPKLVEENSIDALREFAPPPENLDQGASMERQAVALLAVPGAPVALVEGDSTGAVPSLRLVQATSYVVPAPPDATRRGALAQRYRAHWEDYQQTLLDTEIDNRLKE